MAVVASYTRRHQRLRQGTDEANERQQKRTPKKDGRGRAALTRSNWGRSTVRARSKLRFAAVPTNVVAASGSHMAKSSMPTA